MIEVLLPVDSDFQPQLVNVICQCWNARRELRGIGLLTSIPIPCESLPALIEDQIFVPRLRQPRGGQCRCRRLDDAFVYVGLEGVPTVPSCGSLNQRVVLWMCSKILHGDGSSRFQVVGENALTHLWFGSGDLAETRRGYRQQHD